MGPIKESKQKGKGSRRRVSAFVIIADVERGEQLIERMGFQDAVRLSRANVSV